MKTQVELLKESCYIKDAACVRYQKRITELEEENNKLKHKNELQEKALIKLCLKHHYNSIIINWEIVIDMENYTVVEKKKPKEEKLF